MSAHAAGMSSSDSERDSSTAYDARLIRRLWGYTRPHQKWVWLSLALLITSLGCQLIAPWLIKIAIDRYLAPGAEFTGYWGLCVLFTVVSAIEVLARGWQTWTIDVAGQNALVDLRLKVFRHLQNLSSSFYDRTPIGRLIGRVTTDIEALQEMFSSGVVTILADFLFIFATLGILLTLHVQLTLVTLILVPVLLGMTLFIRKRVRKSYAEMVTRRSKLNAFIHEHVTGMPLIQAFRRQQTTRERFATTSSGMRDAQLASVTWESWLSALTEMVGSFAMALILWYGGKLVMESPPGAEPGDVFELGMLFYFIDMMRKFFAPLNELSLKYTVMQNAMTASDRIFALLDETDITPESNSPDSLPEVAGRVSFKNVTFGYSDDEPVLKEVSFEVAPGERVAFVGATGSGKTTILKLISRLYDVQQGSVEIDGVDVKDLKLEHLRRRVGIVPQDVFLFGGSLLDNIRLGRPDQPEEEAIAAADRLHLDQIVERFPRGYHEPVKERGGNLSSGERQLIAFARVLTMQPAILALDEATSNVDSGTEHLLQEALATLLEGRTALIVAHRLSTIRDATRILVVHKGRIVEEGSHDELMKLDGAYSRLVALEVQSGSQAGSPKDPSPSADQDETNARPGGITG